MPNQLPFQSNKNRLALPNAALWSEQLVVLALSGLKGVTVIDVEIDVMTVTRQIAACGLVLSSSLHGLIVADAFGIPNQRLKFSGKLKGEDFKFSDYASALGRSNTLAHVLTAPEDIFLLAKQEFDLSYQGNLVIIARLNQIFANL